MDVVDDQGHRTLGAPPVHQVEDGLGDHELVVARRAGLRVPVDVAQQCRDPAAAGAGAVRVRTGGDPQATVDDREGQPLLQRRRAAPEHLYPEAVALGGHDVEQGRLADARFAVEHDRRAAP